MGKHDTWTDEEDTILIENYKKVSYKEISKLINEKTDIDRSVGAVKTRACIIGVTESKEPDWSEREDDVLLEYRSHKSYSEISKILKEKFNIDRSVNSIYHRCKRLNLEKINWWDK